MELVARPGGDDPPSPRLGPLDDPAPLDEADVTRLVVGLANPWPPVDPVTPHRLTSAAQTVELAPTANLDMKYIRSTLIKLKNWAKNF